VRLVSSTVMRAAEGPPSLGHGRGGTGSCDRYPEGARPRFLAAKSCTGSSQHREWLIAVIGRKLRGSDEGGTTLRETFNTLICFSEPVSGGLDLGKLRFRMSERARRLACCDVERGSRKKTLELGPRVAARIVPVDFSASGSRTASAQALASSVSVRRVRFAAACRCGAWPFAPRRDQPSASRSGRGGWQWNSAASS